MLWLDILFGLLILGSLVTGFRQGILVQLCGIAGILIGVFLALRFGERVGSMMGAQGDIAKVAGFAVLFLATLIIVGVLGRALRGVFRFVGLGMIDRIGGGVLSGVKAILILSLLVMVFDSLNKSYDWVEKDTMSRSKFHKPMREVAGYIAPYFNTLKAKITDDGAGNIE